MTILRSHEKLAQGLPSLDLKLLSHVNADGDLIEAWLKWYLGCGIRSFHLVVHGPPGDNAELFRLRDTYPITIEDSYEGPFACEEKKRRLDTVISRYRNQWLVLADSDEFVEFPYRDIPQTIRMLEFARANVMVAPMLQRLKADGTLDSPELIDDPFRFFPLCSEDLYQRMGSDAYLLKYPLFFCSSQTELEEEGNHSPPRGSAIQTSAMRGVTHHFKFRRTVSGRLDKMIENRQHPWRHESVQFRRYLEEHSNRLPLEGSFPYSRDELFRRRLVRKLSLRNKIKSIGRGLGVVR